MASKTNPQLLITCDLLDMTEHLQPKQLGLLTLLDVWKKAQNPIKTSIGETSYDTWFSHLSVCETTLGVLTIQAPDEYFKNWIDERYRIIIERCLRTEAGQGISIEFSVNSQLLNKKTQQKQDQIENSPAPNTNK